MKSSAQDTIRFVQSRRSLLKAAGAGAGLIAAGRLAPRAHAAASAWTNGKAINPSIPNTRVVCCTDPQMITNASATGSFAAQNSAVNTTRVEANLDAMAIKLSNKRTAPEAWSAIFQKPQAKQWGTVTVAIKVNCMVVTSSARIAVVGKLCKELLRLGVDAKRITVYDAGHTGDGNSLEKHYGPYVGNGLPAGTVIQGASMTRASTAIDGGTANCSKIIFDGSTDILINVGSNKGHYLAFSGFFTLTMKNHFGTFAYKHETDFLFNINKSDAILGGTPVRQQLCLIDSLWAKRDGPVGPPQSAPGILVMGTCSPVVDYLLIKKIREPVMNVKNHDQAIVARLLSDFGFAAAQLEWIEVPPGTTGAAIPHAPLPQTSTLVLRCRTGRSTFEAALTMPLSSGPGILRIIAPSGRLVRQLPVRDGQSIVDWDGRDWRGQRILAGTFIVQGIAGGARSQTQLQVLR